jgi:L-fuconolactonase
MPVTIDAHHHYWELARFEYQWLQADPLEPIRRDYLPSDLQPLLSPAGVDRTIFVQTQHNLAETQWVLELAERHEFMAGVVGWVDLQSPRCEEQLLGLAQHPKLVGVRHVTHDEPDDDFIVRETVLRGLRVLERHGVPFDLLFYARHLRHVRQLGAQLPELPMVLDHLAKPWIKQQRMDNWLEDFRAAAQFPNVYCKLSGMVTEADWHNWRPEDLRPYVETALECFGPQRCMFGSDWPVCELAASYQQVREALDLALGPISDSERAAIFGGTAQRFYQL